MGRATRLAAAPLLAATVLALAACGADTSEPGSSASSAGVFELRPVLEVVATGAPGWDALEVTCLGTEITGSTACLDPSDAAVREVVLVDASGETKYRLGPAALTAEDVASADAIEVGLAGASSWAVVIKLTQDGAHAFQEFTTGLVGERIAIVSDGVVVSAPTVQEPITSGVVQAGNLSKADAEELARRLGQI
jgi:preprotein translocase subunit SecD